MTVDQVTSGRPREDTIAWELIDYVGEHLTNAERHVVFVHLGVADYPPVFRCALEVIARERISVPSRLVEILYGWIDDYDRRREFEAVLTRAVGPTRCDSGSHSV